VKGRTVAGDIVYVDADIEATRMVSPFLKRCAAVRSAASLAEAREVLGEGVPALLVVDPDALGERAMGFLSELRASDPWVQIFVVCAPERAGETALFIAAGASDIAVKPFDVGTITSRVGRLLRAAEGGKREQAYRLQLEHKLRHAERIATLGTLCATVAHEIATPLGVISNNAAVLLETPRSANGAAGEIGEIGEDILLASGMIDAVVKRIRVFSRRNDENPVDAELGEIVETALLLLKPRLLARDVAVTRPVGPSPRISHYPVRLTQALLNALTNALEATEPGGRLRLSWLERPGAVGIEVEDEGPGLPPEMAGGTSETFFTTKREGTGLGLMVIRGILKEHGGSFELAPRADGKRGLSARLVLPSAARRS
jgi:C4-dicarboxylate-specific signal transduction histidine kinase